MPRSERADLGPLLVRSEDGRVNVRVTVDEPLHPILARLVKEREMVNAELAAHIAIDYGKGAAATDYRCRGTADPAGPPEINLQSKRTARL